MRMIPVRSRLDDLTDWLSPRQVRGSTYSEVVGEPGSSWNRTLGNLAWAIHFCGTVHEKAMEMKGGGLISKLVVDIDDDLVTFSRSHHWQRPGIVDANG